MDYLALQAHDPGSIVRFRDIRLKKLARPEANKTSQVLPQVAPGWNIELLAEAPLIQAPTALVQADDGTVYLGQDDRRNWADGGRPVCRFNGSTRRGRRPSHGHPPAGDRCAMRCGE